MLNLKKSHKDSIEINQKQLERNTILHRRIKPHKGHTLYEIHLLNKTIAIAEFSNELTIKWSDALKGDFSKYRKVMKKDNCEYISALNITNCKKIAKRDFNLNIDNFKHI